MEKKREPLRYRSVAATDSKPWSYIAGLDKINDVGCYIVELKHGMGNDELPLPDCDQEHYIVGTLIVTESGTEKLQKNRIVGQTLILPQCCDGNVAIYSRTCNLIDKDYKWSHWVSTQQKKQVGHVTSLDGFTQDGIYSGVYISQDSSSETFVLTVIDNDVAATASGKIRSISQFKNSLNVDGTFSYKTRVGRGAANVVWGEWVDVGAADTTDIQDNSITAQKLSIDVRDRVEMIPALVEYTRDTEATASRLGFYDETITLTSADLLPMTWNGTKMVSSTNYNIWIIPLYNGRRYKCSNIPFIQSLRLCDKRPLLEENITMTAAIGLETGTFTATEDTKYLVITVFIAPTNVSNKKEYDGSSYEIFAFESGLIEDVTATNDNLAKVAESVEKNDKAIVFFKRETNGRLGAKDRTIVLTSDDYDGLIWNGSAFQVATPSYNGFVIPVYPGERIRYIDNYRANNVCTLTEYPTVGSSSRVRTRTELNGDFIVQNNEHCLFLNATVSTFTPYKVIADDGSVSERFDALKRQQSPLYGKTIVCFGDSITEFNDSDGKGWSDYLATMSGANVIRAGIGGTQLATRKEVIETPTDYLEAYGAIDISNLVKAWATKDWTAVDNAITWLASNKSDDNSAAIERLKATSIENVDIVIIFGGSNDFNNSTFGTPTDINPVGNTCGGINQVVDSIQAAKPNMPIYFFTPIPRMATPEIWCDEYRINDKDSEGRSLSFPSLIERIQECVRYNHLPCCDMFNALGINRKNILTYAPDGVHPTKAYPLVANRIYSFIMANRIWQ